MSVQCVGKTIKGKNCTKKTRNSNGYCKLHMNQYTVPQPGEEVLPNVVLPESCSNSNSKEKEKEEEEEEECVVCTDPIGNEKLSCGHRIHKECVVKSGKDICPLCREKVVLDYESKSRMKQIGDRYKREEIREQTGLLRREENLFLRFPLNENLVRILLMFDREDVPNHSNRPRMVPRMINIPHITYVEEIIE